MTKDEIKKLKELAVFKSPLNRHAARMDAFAALPRLLEERERLLEALKRCEWLPDASGNLCCPECWGHALHNPGCALRATRAFAEAPAIAPPTPPAP